MKAMACGDERGDERGESYLLLESRGTNEYKFVLIPKHRYVWHNNGPNKAHGTLILGRP